MSKPRTPNAERIKEARAAERRDRAARDPWFGKRRRAGEVGRTKTKAERSRRACRGRVIA